MHLFLRFAYAHWLYFAIPFFILTVAVRHYYSRLTLYQFPLLSYAVQWSNKVSQLPVYSLYSLRFFILLLLLILLGKPQLVDQKSKVTVEGIDIMMVLDISGSMNCFDDLKDRRTRISIAKQEAVRFVEKRHNDAIGLVLFGNHAIMRCPLTPDKFMLKSILDDVAIRQNDPIHSGTVISQAVITAARHLQKSKAATRIIILLTDGEPSPNDHDPSEAITIAKAFGIKVYTIGVGNNGLSLQDIPSYGIIQFQNKFDTRLLSLLANQTGGKFFDVKKAQDIATIYDEIDTLEKTKYQDNVYMKYHDFFIPLIWTVLIAIFVELILSTFVWTIL
ncbi:VWA domain-containing protein [Candidatus Babeliales bacterium]|nr:VWA domain-containing protein [Candidatus Babeliales bacterium]MBP9843790.1 VWA domain-containing protein [Candidatus Babeliales bacterium]